MATRPTANRRSAIADVLRRRIASQLHLGVLHVGDRLPSVRESAREFDVDPRVTLAAYRELERDRVVDLRQRSGVFVGAGEALKAQFKEVNADQHTEWLIDQAAEALRQGVPAPMFADRMHRALAAKQLRVVVLERNADQLWSTADELRRDYGFDASGVDLDRASSTKRLPPEVRRADLLITTLPSPDVVDLARRAEVPLYTLVMCPALFDEVRRLLRSMHVYFVVSDARFADRLQTLISASASKRRFRVLVYGRDDLSAIPENSPLYLTRLVRDHMQRAAASASATSGVAESSPIETRLLARVFPDVRVFSEESARDLLAFVVRANLNMPLVNEPEAARTSA